jgi:hydrogenase expression/formation protein HypE
MRDKQLAANGSRRTRGLKDRKPSADSREPAPVITLAHGSGGRKMHRLISQVFVRHFGNAVLRRLEDAAEFTIRGQGVKGSGGRVTDTRLALTTDSYVVQPLFFPGGDIGKLAVCGTVNDLAVKGATPKYLSAGFIIGTGFPIEQLDAICRSMARTARKAGVEIVTGDTKVVEAKSSDPVAQWPSGQVRTLDHWTTRPLDHSSPELYINTSGVGVFAHNHEYGAANIRAGDKVFINGFIGDHEAAIALARGQFAFRAKLASDCAPLNGLISGLIRSRAHIRMMRDPTRGGVATTLNEIADAAGLGIVIEESKLPIRPEVHGICELLGMEPVYMANEGKVLILAAASDETKLVQAMRRNKLGKSGTAIGAVVAERKGVWLKTRFGSLRPLLMLEGQQLPRIC